MHFFQSPVTPSFLYPNMLFSALEIIDCKNQLHFRSMNWIYSVPRSSKCLDCVQMLLQLRG
jgi:hypothetical protein